MSLSLAIHLSVLFNLCSACGKIDLGLGYIPINCLAESLLDEARLKREGILAPAPIRQKWQEHLSGKRNWQYLLWDVLMFQAWKERWLPNG